MSNTEQQGAGRGPRRRRHRVRHIVNPHAWFRRIAEGPQGTPAVETSTSDSDPPSRHLGYRYSSDDSPVPYYSTFTNTIDHDTAIGLPLSDSVNQEEVRAQQEEEEAQYKLAVAMSLNDQHRSNDLEDQEQAQLAKAKQVSMAPATSSGAAESLSWSLFTKNCLEWDNNVVDGLYDVWGQFPEILEISPESGLTKLFPSLEELRRVPYTPGDSREVIVVDHGNDSGLCMIDEIAAEAVNHAISLGAEACVKAIARVVIDHMGGHLSGPVLAQRCWEDIQHLKDRHKSLAIPVGEISVGLSRHRALLFKSLADACRLPCKMIRGGRLGSRVTGDCAAVLVRLDEFLYSVDLFTGELTHLARQTEDGRAIVSRPSAADEGGLDWQSDVDEPALVPERMLVSRESGDKTPESANQRAILNLGALDISGLPPVSTNTDVSGRAGSTQSEDYPQVDFSSELPGFPQAHSYPARLPSPLAALDHPSNPQTRVGSRQQPRTPANLLSHLPSVAEQPGVSGLTQEAKNVLSPFQTASVQKSDDLDDDDAELLDGSFEFVGGKVVGPRQRRKQGHEEANLAWPSALSPFSDPCIQDNEVPYENLPLDKGHLMPLVSYRLWGDDADKNAVSASAPLSGNRIEEGNASPPTESAEPVRQPEGNSPGVSDGKHVFNVQERSKAHWKLRQLADVRRHSDSTIFLHNNVGRISARPIEKLDVLPELPHRSSAESETASRANSQVAPAQPLVNVSRIASGSEASCSVDSIEIDEWEIRPEDLQKGRRIGHGSFGIVYRGTWQYTDVAIKELLDQDLSSQLKDEFQKETAIMKRLRHVNVLLFLGVISTPPNMAIVTQFMPRGSLFRILHSPNIVLEEHRKLKMAVDIARGMNYLHSCRPPIVHRDLKSPNLLVDMDFTVKVSDFGLSRVRMSTLLSGKSQAGTPEWTAPEVLRGQNYDESSDCYSYGVILWELLSNKKPWEDKTAMQVIGAVGWGNARLQISEAAHPAMRSLITRCWSEPTKRPTFAHILQELQGLQKDIFYMPPAGKSDEETDQDSEQALSNPTSS